MDETLTQDERVRRHGVASQLMDEFVDFDKAHLNDFDAPQGDGGVQPTADAPTTVTDTGSGQQRVVDVGPVNNIAISNRPLPPPSISGAAVAGGQAQLSMLQRSPNEQDTTPTPVPSHLPDSGHAFVRASTLGERAAGKVYDAYDALDKGVMSTPAGAVAKQFGIDPGGVNEAYLHPEQTMAAPIPVPGGSPIQGFSSRLEQNLLPQVTVPTHPNRILSLMKGRASPEEAEQRGLMAWLKSKGDTKVTPTDLNKFLAEHPLDVRETHYGTENLRTSIDENPDDYGNPPKWNRPDLNLPGGENYREIVLHAPDTKAQAQSVFSKRFQEIRQAHGVEEGPAMNAAITAAERSELTDLAQRADRGASYTSHSFPEKNILAWLRMDDRKLATGDPIAFIQEGQSDWHQAGREKGYADPAAKSKDMQALDAAIAERRAAAQAAREALATTIQRSDALKGSTPEEILSHFANKSNGTNPEFALASWDWSGDGKARQSVRRYLDAFKNENDLTRRLASGGNEVPDAPFKGTGWQELAFNRAIVDAVQRGKKGLGWTTGAQQAERYDKLLTGIGKITWDPADKFLTIWQSHGPQLAPEEKVRLRELNNRAERGPVTGLSGAERAEYHRLLNQNTLAFGTRRDLRAGDKNAVEAIIGKNTAKRLFEAGNVLDTSADPITIGSAGMNQQYDTNWVNHANKTGKPFGMQVQDVSTTAGKYKQIEGTEGHHVSHYAAAPAQETIHYLPFTPEFIEHVKTKGFHFMEDRPSAWAEHNEFVDRLRAPDGGFTVHAVTGHEPTTGYSVTAYPARGVVLPTNASELDIARALDRFHKENAYLLQSSDLNIGGWHDPETGKIFLDVSKNVSTAAEAEAVGRANKEKAYFDHAAGESVPISYSEGGRPSRKVATPTVATLPRIRMTPEGWTKFTTEYPAVAHKGLEIFHNKLMDLSFNEGRHIEHLASVEAGTGRQRGRVTKGTNDHVDITPSVIASWKKSATPLVAAHTHPSSSAFSIDDLWASFNLRQHEGVLLDKMVVFGEDGSWFEMRLPTAPMTDALYQRLMTRHQQLRSEAATATMAKTDQWVADQFHLTFKNGEFTDAQGKPVTRVDLLAAHPEITRTHDRHFRDATVKIWEALTPIFNGVFRYHLAP